MHYTQARIGAHTANGAVALVDLMQRNMHERIDFFKIDIETSEYEIIAEHVGHWQSGKVCQLLIEVSELRFVVGAIDSDFSHFQVHVSHTYNPIMQWHFRSKTTQDVVALVGILERAGFALFAKEANAFSLCCQEYSFIHQSCAERHGVGKPVGTLVKSTSQ